QVAVANATLGRGEALPHQPVDHALDHVIRGGGPGRHAHDLDAVEPGGLDLCLALDVVAGHAVAPADLGQPSRVRALLTPDGQDQVDLAGQPPQRVLPLRGRLADRVAHPDLTAVTGNHRRQLGDELHEFVDVLGR